MGVWQNQVKEDRRNKTSCHIGGVTFTAVQSFVSAAAMLNPQANVRAPVKLMSILSLKITALRADTKPGLQMN